MRNGHHHHHHHVRKKKKVHTIFMNQPNRQKKRRRHAHRYSLWEIHEAPNNNSNWFHDDNPLRQLMDVRFCEEKNNREEDGKEGGLLPKFGHMCAIKRFKRYSWKTGWCWEWRWLWGWGMVIIMCAKKRFTRYSWKTGWWWVWGWGWGWDEEWSSSCAQKKVHTIFMNQTNRQRERRRHTGTICERFTKRRIIIPIGFIMMMMMMMIMICKLYETTNGCEILRRKE